MERQTEFNDLPVEMKEWILNNLDHEGKKVARLVCKQWQKIVERKLIFEIILSDGTYDTFKKFDANTRIEKLVVQNFQKVISSRSATRSGLNKNNIRFLRIGYGTDFPGDARRDPENPYSLKKMFHDGQKYPDTTGVSPANLKTLFEFNTGIEALSVSGTAFTGFKETTMLKRIQWNNLTTLDIHFGSYPIFGPLENLSVEPYVKLLRKVYPSLHTLLYSSTSWKAEFRLFVAVLECVAAHKDTIRRLKIFHTTVYSLNNSTEHGIWYPQEKFNTLAKNLCEARLDYLMIDLLKCGPNSGGRWKQLEKTFLESQTKLTDLRLICSARETVDMNYNSIFNSISTTVTCLTLWLNCIRLKPFDCSALQNCTQLTSLTINLARAGIIFEHPVMLLQNLKLLPKSLEYLVCGQMLADADCVWLSKNMLNLEVLVYYGLRYEFELLKTLEHFWIYLDLPRLQLFRINNFKCDRIIRFAQQTPGLTINHNAVGTEIAIDRKIFTHAGYFVSEVPAES